MTIKDTFSGITTWIFAFTKLNGSKQNKVKRLNHKIDAQMEVEKTV